MISAAIELLRNERFGEQDWLWETWDGNLRYVLLGPPGCARNRTLLRFVGYEWRAGTGRV